VQGVRSARCAYLDDVLIAARLASMASLLACWAAARCAGVTLRTGILDAGNAGARLGSPGKDSRMFPSYPSSHVSIATGLMTLS
jgi:hypothetical protein